MNRLAILLAFLSLTALCSTGCHKDSGTAANSPPPTTPRDNEPEVAPSPDVLALARGNNEFAFDLYTRLAKQDGNLIFSPYSISSALAMTYAGARGDTAAEMEKTLRFPLKPARLHPAFADLSARMMRSGNRDGGQLLVANSLWGQRGYPIRDDFLALTRDDYQAEMQEVDFSNDKDREVARQTINHCVEQKTQDMVQELLKPGVLSKESRLVLVNAIYFRSLWAIPFFADQTKYAPFRTASGESVQVPMMHLTAVFQYHEEDGVQILELPYQDNHFSMVIILPQAADSVAEVEKTLTALGVEGWLAKLKEYEVVVTVPKFGATDEFQLDKELRALGMPLAFRDEPAEQPRADFSGISDKALQSDGCLHISAAIHQTRVEVTEEGAKAAAATAVVTSVTPVKAFHYRPRPRVVFNVAHPFLFLIRDRDTGSILFLGRVTRPGG
ncbi:MAG TPA: serpin family protein [Planctomycetales bacterium]|jgi:serpin B|nr:serpin family protein [Planctomycetales bacterium]